MMGAAVSSNNANRVATEPPPNYAGNHAAAAAAGDAATGSKNVIAVAPANGGNSSQSSNAAIAGELASVKSDLSEVKNLFQGLVQEIRNSAKAQQQQQNKETAAAANSRSFARPQSRAGPTSIAPEDEQRLAAILKPLRDDIENLKTSLIASPYDGTVNNENVLNQQENEYPEPVLGDCPLKSDHFAGVHKLKEPPFLEGVCNFRRVATKPVYGVFQPEIPGIHRVVEYLTSRSIGHKVIYWVNLREEPVVFLNNHPYAPREPGQLNDNITYLLGIKGFELERMERRLQSDIRELLQDSKSTSLSVYGQRLDMTNEEKVIEVDPATGIRTLREVYNSIRRGGVDVRYARIPIQDECAPEEKDFSDLVELLKDSNPEETAYVMNCQMGRGRTTTGMVCATLLTRFLIRSQNNLSFEDAPAAYANRLSKSVVHLGPSESTEESLKEGWYTVIRDLVTALEGGHRIKEQVDEAIDACGALQNLRTAIYDCKVQADKVIAAANGGPPVTGESRPASFWLRRGCNYLERYWYLIVFNAYLTYQGPKGFRQSFTMWMRERWGLKRMLKRLELE